MVKRLVAIGLGAVAGITLWYAVDWLRAPADADEDAVSIENCVRDAFVDCVDFAPDSAPQPCKDWLTGDGNAAVLSQCLHGARRERDAVRIENFQRAQRIAASS